MSERDRLADAIRRAELTALLGRGDKWAEMADLLMAAGARLPAAPKPDCLCGADSDPTGQYPRLDIVCPKHDHEWR